MTQLELINQTIGGITMNYSVVKVDKITGIVLAEQVCANYESANEFIQQVAKLGYEPSQKAGFMYENDKSGLTIR
jgi:hypothetical protein